MRNGSNLCLSLSSYVGNSATYDVAHCHYKDRITMLDQLSPQPADALLALIKLYATDGNPDKIDLGVGVYRDSDGGTPVFAAIKQAEQRLVDAQDSKSYLGPEGDMGFVRGMIPHIFGSMDLAGKIDGVQTPGGTGAVRLACDLLKAAGTTKIWMGTPSWPNHAQIFKAVGMEVGTFTHMDVATQKLNFHGVMDAIDKAKSGDALLLHGCCHNPTGADYNADQWRRIADAITAKNIFPLLDLAYHGLGHGFEEDSIGVRTVVKAVPEALLAYSCDKNFGMYRERVGALYVITDNSSSLSKIMSNVYALARSNWSMPPDHGAAAVRIILEDESLSQSWKEEVDGMRARMRRVRKKLGSYGKVGAVDFTALANQNGLFATLPLTPEHIMTLRSQHSIYMAGSGRINIAGLTMKNIEKFTDAVRAVQK